MRSGNGANHCALGTRGYNSNLDPRNLATYDDAIGIAPTHYGSAGGTSYNATGGLGGGWIHIDVNSFELSGALNANGFSGQTSPANAQYGAGGGSGGSITIMVDAIFGSGSISANGGQGGGTHALRRAGGGSGGAVYVYRPPSAELAPDQTNITVSAEGGLGVQGGQAHYGCIQEYNLCLEGDRARFWHSTQCGSL